jgi:hypothetical protein
MWRGPLAPSFEKKIVLRQLLLPARPFLKKQDRRPLSDHVINRFVPCFRVGMSWQFQG